MSTPHINANKEDIAKTVLMPGDPLRAKYIAETFLKDIHLVNNVRNIFAYTGKYNDKKVTVMGSGMGMPSIGIYSYELFSEYGVENIIRLGSCGSYQKEVKVRDVIIASSASTDSNFAAQYNLDGTYSANASFNLLLKAYEYAKVNNLRPHVGNILSSDVFYNANSDFWLKWAKMGVLGVEMEAYALYCNAAYLRKNALAILTVSDSFVSEETTTSSERETTFNDMVKIGLSLI